MSRRNDAQYEGFAQAQLSHLLRPALYLTGDWHRAQELVQATLVKMYVAWPRLGADVDVAAYARQVLMNQFRDDQRAEARRHRGVGRWLHHNPEVNVAAADLTERDHLGELLAKLPPKQRAVVVLRFLEDLSVEQTAHILGVSPGTVKSQTSDAIAALRTMTATVRGTE